MSPGAHSGRCLPLRGRPAGRRQQLQMGSRVRPRGCSWPVKSVRRSASQRRLASPLSLASTRVVSTANSRLISSHLPSPPPARAPVQAQATIMRNCVEIRSRAGRMQARRGRLAAAVAADRPFCGRRELRNSAAGRPFNWLIAQPSRRVTFVRRLRSEYKVGRAAPSTH